MTTPALSEQRGQSFYLSVAGGALRFIDEYASPYAWLRGAYAHRRPGKAPLWLAEVYQLLWLTILIAVLLTAPHQGYALCIATAVVVVRGIDILANVLNGILLGRVIDSAPRSVFTSLVNILEVVLGSSVLFTNAGCADRFAAFYSAVRTLATIGPESGVDQENVCKAIVAGQVAVDFILVLVIVAVIVGAVKIREGLAAQQPNGADAPNGPA